jgi:hypothetical protein
MIVSFLIENIFLIKIIERGMLRKNMINMFENILLNKKEKKKYFYALFILRRSDMLKKQIDREVIGKK